ncbi:MAG: family 10 glycosylhydrolase [Thermoguttaceae bacterium]|nr:family 10 glycosylhydrolase [Thermoguttaceae bacterium]
MRKTEKSLCFPVWTFFFLTLLVFVGIRSPFSVHAEKVYAATDGSRLLISDFKEGTLKWQDVSHGQMPLVYIPEGLRVSTNFKEFPMAERVSIDANVELDLTQWNHFELETAVSNTKAFSSASIYFRSGKGWYSCSAGVLGKNGKLTFRKSDFRTEGEPEGWERIQTVRLSFWRIGTEESDVIFSSLAGVMEPILFVSVLNSEGVELWVGKNNARLLNDEALVPMEISADQLTMPKEADEEMWKKLLEKRLALIVNHTMHLKPETRAFLEKWAEENGTVLILLDRDLRKMPMDPEAFLRELANSAPLRKKLENAALCQAVTLFGTKAANEQEIVSEAKAHFQKDLIAGIRFCRETHEKNLRESVANFDADHSMKFRAWWNHSGLGAYPGDWKRTAKELRAAGFTAVIPNMLWVGEAHYPSQWTPTGPTFEKYGDQMAQCVEACHAEGLEVHVWRVCFNAKHHVTPERLEKFRTEGRLQVNRAGEEIPWLCPSHPANIELEVGSMLEIPEKYDVDGVHFDYIRYDSGCWCDGCRERFEKKSGRKVENWPKDVLSGERKEEFYQWRADQITHIVKSVSKRMRAEHPDVKLSAAVFQGYPGTIYSVGQDWGLWAREGCVDFLCPMNYTLDAETFENLCRQQMKVVPEGFPLYFGVGEWKLRPDETFEQLYRADRAGAKGFTIFDLSERAAGRILSPLTKEK